MKDAFTFFLAGIIMHAWLHLVPVRLKLSKPFFWMLPWCGTFMWYEEIIGEYRNAPADPDPEPLPF